MTSRGRQPSQGVRSRTCSRRRSDTRRTPSSARVFGNLCPEYLSGPLDPAFASGHQAVEVRPAHQGGAGSAGNSRNDVAAGQDAAVDIHLGVSAYGVHHRGKDLPDGVGALSNWRPPWFDTITASAPASTALRASATVMMPLTIEGQGEIQPCEVGDGRRRIEHLAATWRRCPRSG